MNYKSDLINKILPIWLDNAIDYENGGIYTCLDREGNIYGREKSVWFQGRALWVLSKTYNTVEKDETYLKAAKCIYDFLPRVTGEDGRMPFTVTADGREIQKRRYYFSETFAAIGCAEYYKATGDEQAFEKAEAYFDTAYRCYKGEIKNPAKFNPENHPFKGLSPVMIMLATAQVMQTMKAEVKDKYAKIAESFLQEVRFGGFLTEKALLENVDVNGKPVDSPTGRIVNPGHSMEAAWFVMAQGILMNDPEVIECGRHIIDITLPLGWDQKHGGIIAFTDVAGKPPVQLEWDMKLWWPQCETMIAARLAYILFGDEKYRKLCEDLESYCEKYFVDEEFGDWYGYLHYDNTPSTTLKGNIFKGPFHIPRLYIIMALLDETGRMDKFLN